MRFIIVLGVLLCLIQLVAGTVKCIVANYYSGDWKPVDKARLREGAACTYSIGLNSGRCTVSLDVVSEKDHKAKIGCYPVDGYEYRMNCACASEKCNIDQKNLSELKLILPTDEPKSAGDTEKKENDRKYYDNLAKSCDISEVLKSMPDYSTVAPPKLMKCNEGILFVDNKWVDKRDLISKSQQEACYIAFLGDPCTVKLLGVETLTDSTNGCEVKNNKAVCSCNTGDDCHMDMISEAFSQAEEEIKAGRMKPEIVKCMEQWRSVAGPYITTTTTAAPPTESASRNHVLVISAAAMIFYSL